MERLILDTGAVIALERSDVSQDEVLAEDADVAVSAVTASELLVGVALADTGHRAQLHRMVEGTLERVEVIAFDLEVARQHTALLAHVRQQGRTRGAHDLQIAATARATGRALITTDAHAFDELPGVVHRVIPGAR